MPMNCGVTEADLSNHQRRTTSYIARKHSAALRRKEQRVATKSSELISADVRKCPPALFFLRDFQRTENFSKKILRMESPLLISASLSPENERASKSQADN
jgi:hypothetical protein